MGENKDYITYPDEKGSINISEDVIAMIAANAAIDTDGVAALSVSLGKDIAEKLGKKNLSKGVRIAFDESGLRADIYIIAKIGTAVNKVGAAVQKNVAAAVESMTGVTVCEVNVHVCGISLECDK